MVLRQVIRTWLRFILPTIVAAAIPALLAAQSGRITGSVTDNERGDSLATVQVNLQGTQLGALTAANGRFNIVGVPPGTYTVIAQRVGYAQAKQLNVVVGAGATVTVNLQMGRIALSMQSVVSTGVTDPTAGVLAPVTVAHLDLANNPAPVSGSAVQNLQGQIAGVRIQRTSGQPGSESSIILRTPTSVTQSGAPMIVVDGVILGSQGTVDIESLDIESVEVIKGAAASSLYGSRAGSGVISIKTKRGADLAMNTTVVELRTELGVTQALNFDYVSKHHAYMMDSTNSYYVNAIGDSVGRANRVMPSTALAFEDKPFPTQTYDNVGAVTQPGGYRTNNFSVSGKSGSSNFALTLNTYNEQGALVGNKGFQRQSIRLNLDHDFQNSFVVGASMYYARDDRAVITNPSPFSAAASAPIDIDFTKKDSTGQYLQQPDPLVAIQNPLWTQSTRENTTKGDRILIGSNVSWKPLSFLTFTSTAGLDGANSETRVYVPKGTPINVGSTTPLDGSLSYANSNRATWNADAQVSLQHNFGRLNTRSSIRGILEQSQTTTGNRSGSNFILYDVPQLSNFASTASQSSYQEEWAEGGLWNTDLNYDEKYIFTGLIRRDGSSLFGTDNRWHYYYRVAGAWRIGQERWFAIPHVSELKLSVAQGTAGGRPPWNAQYETWNISNGVPTKGNLGNQFLAPEHTTEDEYTLNAIVFERIGITATYAHQHTTDQLVQAPLPVITGYSTQWINSGAITGHTLEGQIEGQMIRKKNLTWTSTIVADHSYSEITEWDIPCDASNAWRLYCQGAPVYGQYALHVMRVNSPNGNHDTLESALAKHRGGELLPFKDQFQVNDEGYIVWVGTGNNYTDGIAKSLWGTTSPTLGGRTYDWGIPIIEQNELGNNRRQLLGKSNPINLGWVNDVRLGNWNFHAQLQSAIGGTANNTLTHDLLVNFNAKQEDQSGKPDGLKKPLKYYVDAVQGNTDYNVYKASYTKLRELSATYTFTTAHLARLHLAGTAVKSLSVGLIARNLFILTSYPGFDPEQALDLGTRSNADAGGYPSTRNFTASFSVKF